MSAPSRAFGTSVLLTAGLAGLAIGLAQLPGIDHIGPLATALLLGLAWRAALPVPGKWQAGIKFSAKRLLRLGIILLGVRLNLALVAEAGLRILMIDLTVIVVGLAGISWVGRRFGLDPVVAALIAVDSSICGGSAVVAAAPVLRAKDHEVALVLPMCSILGTSLMLIYTMVQHAVGFTPEHYGMMVGATLHEVAQVVAAVTPFPDSIGIGTVTKLTRVVFLVPALAVLGWVVAKRKIRAGGPGQGKAATSKPWFVLGFLIVGVVNTLLIHYWPAHRAQIAPLDHGVLTGSVWLMSMAMAAMGLQTDFAHLRKNGARAVAAAVCGWLGVASLVWLEIWVLG